MDIHRCRFVPYPPSAINALAFSHTSSLESKSQDFPTLRLAIGRANGDVEIWNPLGGAWFQESIFRGGKDRSIEGLVWTQDPEELDKKGLKLPGKLRLFSIGYSTAVTEWDLELGRPLRNSIGNYGELWCIAAQPRLEYYEQASVGHRELKSDELEIQEQKIVVGCADGAIVLFSTLDGDLRFLKALARPSKKKARVLSITFQNRTTVVAGHADSTIRVFDIRNAQQIRNMSLGAGPLGGPKEILVWSVRCLVDGTIVSGDSIGTVRFWDGKTYTLLQRIQSHVADILDIEASGDGETVISCGMDRRTTIYGRIGSGKTTDKRRWAELAHRRLHEHDVKAMATFETEDFSILASGGLDTKPIITPVREYGRENHRSLSGLPQQPSVGGASTRRLILSWWECEIRIWWLPCYDQARFGTGEEGNASDGIRTRKLAARIAVQGDEALSCVDISSDGRLVVACTISSVKIFYLRHKGGANIKVSKFEAPSNVAGRGARMAKFSPDGKWLLLITANNEIQMYRLAEAVAKKRPQLRPGAVHLKRLSRDPIRTKFHCGSLGNYERSISRIAFSADSRILATGDLSGHLDTWVLEGHEDLTQEDDEELAALESSELSDGESVDEERNPNVILGQHWIRNPAASLIPRLPTAPLVLSFRPPRIEDALKQTNGNTAIHPTRNNPHPHSHDLPDGEDRLLAFTSNHEMYEFEVLKGKLSNWSRKNPSSSLPARFREIMEPAMGSIWDVSRHKERIWLYGASWLWMFDLSKDFPATTGPEDQVAKGELPNMPNSVHKRKRKDILADPRQTEEARKHNSGAGGKKPRFELEIGIGRKFHKSDGAEMENNRWVSMDAEQIQASDDDDDDPANELSVVSLPTDSGGMVQITNGLAKDDLRGDSETHPNSHGPQIGLPFWGTHQYRDIMGVIPLGDRNENVSESGITNSKLNPLDDELAKRLEVALVERPIWEVDLPPRYEGNQEWNR